jgi:hypothetical protein
MGAVLFLLANNTICEGIVLHKGHEPGADWMDKPNDAVVGRWGSNASCVAISPNYIITTRHQGNGVGIMVYFADMEYKVAEVWNASQPGYDVDLRVCRITTPSGAPANLTYYAPPYPLTNELGLPVVMGGYGDGRGAELMTNSIVYGYAWNITTGNTVEQWCTNLIENTGTLIEGAYRYEYMQANFDGPGATIYEGAVADHDSGGRVVYSKRRTMVRCRTGVFGGTFMGKLVL